MSQHRTHLPEWLLCLTGFSLFEFDKTWFFGSSNLEGLLGATKRRDELELRLSLSRNSESDDMVVVVPPNMNRTAVLLADIISALACLNCNQILDISFRWKYTLIVGNCVGIPLLCFITNSYERVLGAQIDTWLVQPNSTKHDWGDKIHCAWVQVNKPNKK